MDESSPCLVRSLSQPSDSETKEADPLRALRTSVSFGRYVSDSSSWEKWSCFSNNRYLEEAEKISKPGSVAEKKALLEAHFKKISAKKANMGTHDNESSTVNNSCTNSLLVLESSETASQVVSNEMQKKGGAHMLDHDVDGKELDINKMEEFEMETKSVDSLEKVIQCEGTRLPKKESEHNKNATRKQEKMPIVDYDNQGNAVSTSKKKQSLSTSKLFTEFLASKLRSSIKISPPQPNKDDSATQTIKKIERDTLEKKISTLKSLHMLADYSSRCGENIKRSNPMVQKTGEPKGVRTFSKISRDTSTPHQTPTRASVAGTLTQPSSTIQTQKSNKTLDKPPVPRSTAEPQIPPIDSKTRGHNTQSPIVASSFSLRCEGRVAKRKEYFQKLEEKQKAKEAAKVHLQAKSKISVTRPQTPKDRKQLTSSMVVDNGSRHLWRPNKIHDATKTNEKSTQTPIRSSCIMSRKNKTENSSPNTQRWL